MIERYNQGSYIVSFPRKWYRIPSLMAWDIRVKWNKFYFWPKSQNVAWCGWWSWQSRTVQLTHNEQSAQYFDWKTSNNPHHKIMYSKWDIAINVMVLHWNTFKAKLILDKNFCHAGISTWWSKLWRKAHLEKQLLAEDFWNLELTKSELERQIAFMWRLHLADYYLHTCCDRNSRNSPNVVHFSLFPPFESDGQEQ